MCAQGSKLSILVKQQPLATPAHLAGPSALGPAGQALDNLLLLLDLLLLLLPCHPLQGQPFALQYARTSTSQCTFAGVPSVCICVRVLPNGVQTGGAPKTEDQTQLRTKTCNNINACLPNTHVSLLHCGSKPDIITKWTDACKLGGVTFEGG